MKTKVKITVFIAVVFVFSVCYFITTSYNFTINRRFQNAVAGCNKIVIRNGEWNPNTAGKQVLRIITDPCDVADFIKAIKFTLFKPSGLHTCPGDLTIDFFSESHLVMTATTPHNSLFRSPLANYDVPFTDSTEQFFKNLMNEFPADASGVKHHAPTE